MSNPEYGVPLPELNFFLRLRYDLFLTVSPEYKNYFGNKKSFTLAHEGFSKRLFALTCSKMKMDRSRLYYFGRSEFGMRDFAHFHLLFSLDRCREHFAYQKYKSSLIVSVKKSLEDLFSKDDFFDGVFQIHCKSTGVSHSDGASLASYLCKEKYASFRDSDLQNFVFSKKNTEESFVNSILKRDCRDADAVPAPAQSAWRAEVRNGKWKDLTLN
jgi:hypothetical protein